jgi:hypothetical protein
MRKLNACLRRLKAKAAPIEAIRIVIAFAQPDGSESAPHMRVYGGEPRPATAAEIAGEGAGSVVTMRESEDFRL